MPQTIVEETQQQKSQSQLQNWLKILNTRYAGLCFYQWLWIVLCIIAGLVVAVPRVLSQPLIYRAVAETRFDINRYGGLYLNGEPGPDFHIAKNDAIEALRQRALARKELRFGRPDYHVAYLPQEPGVVEVQGVAPTASEAQALANQGADELVRQIQAAGGREILRNLLGWELVAAVREEKISSPFDYHLRSIIERGAFPMSRPIEPVSARIRVEDLTLEEQNDLARALEARYDLLSFELNTRNATLDHLCNTAYSSITAIREAALKQCAAIQPAAMHELEMRNRVIARRQAINDALNYMLNQQGATFTPEQEGVVYRISAELPDSPVPHYTIPLLTLTVLMGLAFGVVSVAIDKSAGVMSKIQELWSYNELVRDLVVRDLRVRYKGSVLGYLWTQLAPLLMMTVFTFVFTLLLPSGISNFPVFLIVGLLPWNYCSEAISAGTRCVIDSSNLIKKIFFPREILPLVSVLSSLINYLLSLPMMFFVMAVTQWLLLGRLNFSWTFLYMPVILIIQTGFILGLTLFISSLAVFFRDTVHLIGIVLMFWFFLTPVFYSLDSVSISSLARIIRWVNPMASIVEFYREVLYGSAVPVGMIPTPGLPALDSVFRVVVTVLIMLGFGYWFFQRQSSKFGELL